MESAKLLKHRIDTRYIYNNNVSNINQNHELDAYKTREKFRIISLKIFKYKYRIIVFFVLLVLIESQKTSENQFTEVKQNERKTM